MMAKKVEVAAKKCVGCASCVLLAPGIFALAKGRKSQVINQPVGESGLKALADAVNVCPAGAIAEVEGIR